MQVKAFFLGLNMKKYAMNHRDGLDCLFAATKEIEARLLNGDYESALSIAKAAQISVTKGIDSVEMQAFMAIELARLS